MAEEKNPVWVLDDSIVLLTLPSPDFLVGQIIKTSLLVKALGDWILLLAAERTLMLQPSHALK